MEYSQRRMQAIRPMNQPDILAGWLAGMKQESLRPHKDTRTSLAPWANCQLQGENPSSTEVTLHHLAPNIFSISLFIHPSSCI